MPIRSSEPSELKPHQLKQLNNCAKTMRQSALFLSRFAVSLWVVLISAFVLLLWSEAPVQPGVPFAGLSVRAESQVVHLPNRIFACTESDQAFRCSASIQAQPLELTWTKGGNYTYNITNCQAVYGDRPVTCVETGQTYANGLQSIYEIRDSPTWNVAQLRSLQQQYWGINALMQLGELRLIWICTGLSMASGLTAAYFAWFHPNRITQILASLVCGFGVYQLARGGLGRVPFAAVTRYGLTDDQWMLLFREGSIAAGIAASLITVIVLWGRLNRPARVLGSLVSSLGVFSLCLLSMHWSISYSISSIAHSFGLRLSEMDYLHLFRTVSVTVSIGLAIAAAILLWVRTRQSIKAFVCLTSSFGLFALATNFFILLLIGLGYAD